MFSLILPRFELKLRIECECFGLRGLGDAKN
jgi:hypothetical protein